MDLYIGINDYFNMGHTAIESEYIEEYLKKAQRIIDILTFNRIRRIGIHNVSDYEFEIIEEVQAEIADFLYENQEILSSIFSSYSINGVDMKINPDWKVDISSGYAIPKSAYNKLQSTRFCSLSMRGFR